MTRSVTERMAEVKARMIAANGSRWKRTPKAFYLNADDHAEFMATDPPLIDATFRRKPSRERGFDGVPVRQIDPNRVTAGHRGTSALYSEAGTAMSVPVA